MTESNYYDEIPRREFMIINGLSPGLISQEQQITNLAEKRLAQEISTEKEALKKETIEKETSDNENDKEKESSSKYVINDYNLKELLFLMTSRGNSATIEKLAQLLKKEKEMITKIK